MILEATDVTVPVMQRVMKFWLINHTAFQELLWQSIKTKHHHFSDKQSLSARTAGVADIGKEMECGETDSAKTARHCDTSIINNTSAFLLHKYTLGQRSWLRTQIINAWSSSPVHQNSLSFKNNAVVLKKKILKCIDINYIDPKICNIFNRQNIDIFVNAYTCRPMQMFCSTDYSIKQQSLSKSFY